MTDALTRILLVDDQSLLRLGFRMVLEAEPGFVVVGEAADGASAIEAVREHRPDVVLMDVRMPGMNGIDATAAIVGHLPGSRVIILTTFDLDEYAFAAIRAGASGFLLKDARPSELVSAIRSVAAGDAALSPRVTRQLLGMVGRALPVEPTAVMPPDDRIATLTDREREVLVAMAEGLTNTEIAEAFTVSESTVKTHVGRVLMKLGARDRVHAVIIAFETGLVTLGP